MVEDKFEKTRQVLVEKFELPKDVVMNLPKITITGDNEICIENHKGVVLFEDSEVKINSRVGIIRVCGKEFEILFMGGSTLILKGVFRCIAYEGYE